jgi:predicted anti-sigma-YlaC factor YlaD
MVSVRGRDAVKRDRLPDDLTAPSACEWVQASATDYLEGAIAPAQRRALDTHLAHCPECRRYYDDIRRTVALVRRLRNEELPPEITGSPDEMRRRHGDT